MAVWMCSDVGIWGLNMRVSVVEGVIMAKEKVQALIEQVQSWSERTLCIMLKVEATTKIFPRKSSNAKRIRSE